MLGSLASGPTIPLGIESKVQRESQDHKRARFLLAQPDAIAVGVSSFVGLRVARQGNKLLSPTLGLRPKLVWPSADSAAKLELVASGVCLIAAHRTSDSRSSVASSGVGASSEPVATGAPSYSAIQSARARGFESIICCLPWSQSLTQAAQNNTEPITCVVARPHGVRCAPSRFAVIPKRLSSWRQRRSTH